MTPRRRTGGRFLDQRQAPAPILAATSSTLARLSSPISLARRPAADEIGLIDFQRRWISPAWASFRCCSARVDVPEMLEYVATLYMPHHATPTHLDTPRFAATCRESAHSAPPGASPVAGSAERDGKQPLRHLHGGLALCRASPVPFFGASVLPFFGITSTGAQQARL